MSTASGSRLAGLGRLDVVLANAGIASYAPALEMAEDA